VSGRPTKCRYCRYTATKKRCHGKIFWLSIFVVHIRHPANTTEPSVCGGDAALCQITLTTCYTAYGKQPLYFTIGPSPKKCSFPKGDLDPI